MTAIKKPTFWPLLVFALSGNAIGIAEETGNFQWQFSGSNPTYSVKQTGENYSFVFAKRLFPGLPGPIFWGF